MIFVLPVYTLDFDWPVHKPADLIKLSLTLSSSEDFNPPVYK